jgi:hypothetical protein
MGKRNRLREARRRHFERAVCAVLEAHSKKRDVRPRAVERYGDFKPEHHKKVEALRGYALRAPQDWRCRIKSRSDDKRLLDLVRFCFAKYPVAAHLEAAWIEDFDDDFVDRVTPRRPANGSARSGLRLRHWYMVVAQGGSLYKQEARPFLSKLEAHHFLNPPADLTTARAAFWYAFARAQTDDVAAARNVAKSKLDQFSVASSFWKDAARYFARNPAPVREIDELIDFIFAAKQEDDSFSLRGRALPALRRRMEDWHRTLRKSQAIGGGAWAGRPIPDIDYEAGSERKKAIWRFRQIRTGNELFREGQRQHHCVVTYKHHCLSGDISIWSLRSEYPAGQVNRGVTMEVRRDGAIVQCRGFANRLPYGNEVSVIKRWAADHGLEWKALER